ncbi:unnamed protein product [Tetraodon nigroviridis]|uniref:Chromosome undetermined SCAF3152, whole genome shotgun sequence n=1 Tax=Tetraodon nigroviridis TaxID=99883 RepID=Q4TH79_TETNG|nr:unnamed protein product [Tetraodon nigroviridis]
MSKELRSLTAKLQQQSKRGRRDATAAGDAESWAAAGDKPAAQRNVSPAGRGGGEVPIRVQPSPLRMHRSPVPAGAAEGGARSRPGVAETPLSGGGISVAPGSRFVLFLRI